MEKTVKEKLVLITQAYMNADIELNTWEAEFISNLSESLEDLEELQVEPSYTDAQAEQINKIYDKYEDSI